MLKLQSHSEAIHAIYETIRQFRLKPFPQSAESQFRHSVAPNQHKKSRLPLSNGKRRYQLFNGAMTGVAFRMLFSISAIAPSSCFKKLIYKYFINIVIDLL